MLSASNIPSREEEPPDQNRKVNHRSAKHCLPPLPLQDSRNLNNMTQLVVCGLNYHSAPVAIREKFAIPTTCMDHALNMLSTLPHVKEAVLLSTCNRIEVYAVVSDVQSGLNELRAFFAAAQSIPDHQSLKPNFVLLGDDVALHL